MRAHLGGRRMVLGANDSGQLGTGDNTDRAAPVQVTTALTFASLSAGHRHTCGLTSNGAAYCWGAGGSGRRGDDDSVSTSTPVAVAGSRTWTRVSAGRAHTCGLEAGGTAWCWGRNAEGQLGNAMPGTNTATPTPVDGGTANRATPTPVRLVN